MLRTNQEKFPRSLKAESREAGFANFELYRRDCENFSGQLIAQTTSTDQNLYSKFGQMKQLHLATIGNKKES